MRILKGQILIFLIIYLSESSCAIEALYAAATKVRKFYSTLRSSNLASLANPLTVQELFGDDYRTNENIRDQMYEIHVILREIEKSINPETKYNLNKIVRSEVIALKCVDTMEIFIESIANAYQIFYHIMIQDGFIYNRPLNNLATSVFPNIESNIEMIRNIMTDPNESLLGESGLIADIANYAKARREEICNSYQSIDEVLIYLFKIAIIAEIKTSIMWPFANLHAYRENQEWKIFNALAATQFQKYFRNYSSIIQQSLNLTENVYMRACDPTDGAWILNENCYEFEGMTQAIIFRYDPMICPYQSCRNKWLNRAFRCDARYYDAQSGCSSTPTECEDFGVVQACVLNRGKFQYVNSSISGFYGNHSECPKDEGYILDNLNGLHSGYATCSCQCNRNHNKISLVTMESLMDSNEVIIGLRLKRRNNILHIQPRVGVLMANGYIQKYSERWLPIPNDIDESQIHPIDTENNLFFLDDVLLPPKFVLTGVKFNKVTRETVTGFAIEIFGVPFDYKSGQLDLKGGISLSAAEHNLERRLIFLPVSSLRTKRSNTPSPSDREYVQLTQSLLRSDFGQTVLPLFDGVPITTDPPSALGGIGIFHKGVEGYAGFISLRIYGIRYTQYFRDLKFENAMTG